MLFTMTLQAPCNKTASSLRSHREHSQEHGGEQTHLHEPQRPVERQGGGVVVVDVEADNAVGPDMIATYGVHDAGQSRRPDSSPAQVGARPQPGQLGDATGRGAPQGPDISLEGHEPG